MFHLDLKRAETALDAGRLEDAWRILRSSRSIGHASGQKLIDRLVASLLDRSESHLVQQNFSQAQRDVELAERLGGRQLRVACVAQQLNEARGSIERQAKQEREQKLGEQIARLVDTGDHEEAVSRFATLNASCRERQEFDDLIRPSVRHLTERAREDLVSGRLDRCEATLGQLSKIRCNGTKLQELRSQLKRCYNVRKLIQRSDYRVAMGELKLLAQVAPDSDWVQEMIESVSQCMKQTESVNAGPFGLLSHSFRVGNPSIHSKVPRRDAWTQNVDMMEEPSFDNNEFPRDQGSSNRSILQVDQLGSLLLVQGPTCSIGSVTNSRCDVSLQTDGLKAKILICRDGEDFFATSKKAFFVNDLLADRHLLNHGDTISVGARGRLKFCLPVTASSTAVLQIMGSKMKRRDIRSIVLMGDAILFGRNRGHFRLRDFTSPIILRADHKATGEFIVHQQGEQDYQSLGLDSSVRINSCRFALGSASTTRSIG